MRGRIAVKQGSLQGIVRSTSGESAAAVVVMLSGSHPTPDIAALTGDDGSFRFDDLDAGEYIVIARAETGETARATASVPSGGVGRVEIDLA
jgi:hypothetical protein